MKKMKNYLFLFAVAMSVTALSACSGKVENKQMDVTIQNETYSGTYTGDTESKKPSGEGEFSGQSDGNQIKYTGEWTDGAPSGKGKVENLPVKITITKTEYEGNYTGDTVDGKPDGTGDFKYEKDDVKVSYSGSWSKGNMSGDGKLEDSDFTIWFPKSKDKASKGAFSGDTKDGHPSKGSYTGINSEGEKYTYTGEWANDTWEGQGKRDFENSEINDAIGTFKNGSFTPTLRELMVSLGTWKIIPFTLSDTNGAFIDKNEDLFIQSKQKGNSADAADTSISYKQYIKQPEAYEGKLMITSNQQVLQIGETKGDSYPGGVLTQMLTLDSENYEDYYVAYYCGSLKDIYQDSQVVMVGLPIASTYFDNTSGGQTNCVVLLLTGLK